MPSLLAPIEGTPYGDGNVPGDLSITAAGLQHVRKHNLSASASPGVGDDTADGYEVGSLWTDTTADKAYLCLDATAGAAVWTELTAVTTPAGTGTEIQYRNGSAFGAVTGSSWNATTLSLPQSLVASNLYVGNALTSATPTAGYLKATSGSGTNVAGANLYLDAGQGTGSATGGSVIIRTAPAGTSGTALAALVDRVTVTSAGYVGINGAPVYFPLEIHGSTAQVLLSSATSGVAEIAFSNNPSYGSAAAAKRGLLAFGTQTGSERYFSISALNAAAGLAEVLRIRGSGTIGINTTAPDKALEINSATGDCLRLAYNDANGSATYYTDFTVSPAGNLTITPSGGIALLPTTTQLQFRDTGLYLFSQADGYLNIVADTGVRIGDATPTNYTQFDATGHQTMVGTAKPWEDLRIEPSARTTGANAPTFEKWLDDVAGTSRGVYLYSFDDAAGGSEKEVFFSMQMPHAWDGGPIGIHVHWIGDVDDTTADPRWGLEYAWKDIGEVFGDTTTVYSDGTHITTAGADANVTAKKHYITKMGTFTPGATADGLSSIFIGRLFRDSANAADTYNAAGAKCGLLYIDAHYQINSLGSTDEYTK